MKSGKQAKKSRWTLKQKRAVIIIQKNVRGFLQRKVYTQMLLD